MNSIESRVSVATSHFWSVRSNQLMAQGSGPGTKDQGNRGAVTGGAHCDGFIELVAALLTENGTPPGAIFRRRADVVLPGWFRATKDWDLIVVLNSELVASVEIKSQVGSFGNNFNNRVEEALGNALDLHSAYREGAFKPSSQPWLGWFMLLEDCAGSRSPVRVTEPHFRVFTEFRGASYARRYELFAQKLVRERLYSSACLLLSDRENGKSGAYQEPSEELSFKAFAGSLVGHVSGYLAMRK